MGARFRQGAACLPTEFLPRLKPACGRTLRGIAWTVLSSVSALCRRQSPHHACNTISFDLDLAKFHQSCFHISMFCWLRGASRHETRILRIASSTNRSFAPATKMLRPQATADQLAQQTHRLGDGPAVRSLRAWFNRKILSGRSDFRIRLSSSLGSPSGFHRG